MLGGTEHEAPMPRHDGDIVEGGLADRVAILACAALRHVEA
jgi:hypothetical protein